MLTFYKICKNISGDILHFVCIIVIVNYFVFLLLYIFPIHTINFQSVLGWNSKGQSKTYILILKILLDLFLITVMNKAPTILQFQIFSRYVQVVLQHFIIILFFHYTINSYQASCSFCRETYPKPDTLPSMFCCRDDILWSERLTLMPASKILIIIPQKVLVLSYLTP